MDNFEESPVFQKKESEFTNSDGTRTYSDSSNQGYQIDSKLVIPWITDYYHDMEYLVGNRPQSQARPVDQPQSIELNFRWHSTSLTQTSRNRLRFGTLHTPSQKITLWGFDSWTEFKSHITSSDWKSIGPLRDQLTTDIALDKTFDRSQIGYWLAKDEKLQTRPGIWIISIDNPNTGSRSLVIGYQDHVKIKSPLKTKQQTVITTSWT